jgi:hypothetical protein
MTTLSRLTRLDSLDSSTRHRLKNSATSEPLSTKYSNRAIFGSPTAPPTEPNSSLAKGERAKPGGDRTSVLCCNACIFYYHHLASNKSLAIDRADLWHGRDPLFVLCSRGLKAPRGLGRHHPSARSKCGSEHLPTDHPYYCVRALRSAPLRPRGEIIALTFAPNLSSTFGPSSLRSAPLQQTGVNK